MKTSNNGIALIKALEGCRLIAYWDALGGVWSNGYGFVVGVKEGDVMTQDECDARLASELRAYEAAVQIATLGKCSQNEFDALVCCAWNIGIDGMQGSSMIKAHNRGDKAAAARAFGLWNKAGGKVVPGLVRRRSMEAALYLTPVDAAHDMPQAVTPEKPMTSSSTVIAGGTAALATATQVAGQVAALKEQVGGLGDWLMPALAVVALVAIGYIIYERYQSRDRGNA